MAFHFHHLLLLTILAVISLSSDVSSAALGGGGRKDSIHSGYKKIDPTSPEAIENAKFAIDEHNKKAKTKLQFQTVVSAEKEVVAGLKYRLVIRALLDAASKDYEAIVWVKPWLKFKKLISFRPILD